MEQTLNIYLDYDSPNKDPNPAELAKKYGVESDDDASDEEDEKIAHEMRSKLEEEVEVESAKTNVELLSKVKQMTVKLTEKHKEIDRLCSLLEAIEPVKGGVDPEKFLKMYDSAENQGREMPDTDYRDVKIVALAKKVRKITLQLNKERSAAETVKTTLQEKNMKIEKLTKELNLLSSPAARAAAIRNVRKDIKQNAEEADINELRQMAAAANKQTEETKRKYALLQEENKKLQRALAKEVGEGAAAGGGSVSMEKVLDEGWRGRAQQILTLKNKIKKMEGENTTLVTALQHTQQSQGFGGFGGTNTNSGLGFNFSAQQNHHRSPSMGAIGEEDETGDDISTQFGGASIDMSVLTNAMKTYGGGTIGGGTVHTSHTRADTVDTKATARIESMAADRQQAIDSLITDRERLIVENESIVKKSAALKSRIKILENDSKQQKESMKILIDKTDSDDQLVEMLKAEIQRLKETVKTLTVQAKKTKMESEQAASSRNQVVGPRGGVGAGAGNGGLQQKSRMVMDKDSLEMELSRVKRLLDQQASQLDTQDEVIRKLRQSEASNGNSRNGSNKSYY